MEALLKDESAPDCHSYNLYGVLTLTTKAYTEAFLKDGSAFDGNSCNLYQVLTLTVRAYT